MTTYLRKERFLHVESYKKIVAEIEVKQVMKEDEIFDRIKTLELSSMEETSLTINTTTESNEELQNCFRKLKLINNTLLEIIK